MKFRNIGLVAVVVGLFFAQAAPGQEATSQDARVASSEAAKGSTEAIVPRLIKFSGALLDEQNRPMTGPVGVTFALYAQESGGAALWMETQNVHPDSNGNYTVLLGAASKDGLPAEQFVSGEARWLGLQVENWPEHSRVLLVSVPYALKAHDAETLGGLPASAFLSAPQGVASNGAVSSSTTANGTHSAATPLAPACAFTGGGTTNFIPLWTGACSFGNSLFFQTGGNVGLSTITPKAKLDVEAPATDATGVLGVTPSTAFFAAGVWGNATGTTGVTRGVYGTSSSSSGIGVHGIAATGGQFETGSATGNIVVGRGLGSTRFTISPVGNVHTTGNLRVDGSVSVGGSGLVQVDAPSIPGGRFTILANGNVGINNPSPANRLTVLGNNVAGATAIVGQAAPAAIPGTGVLGTAGADGTGVAGSASVPGGCGGLELCSATGVSGNATGAAGVFLTGVSGSANGAGGIGVQGNSNSSAGFGVQGTGPNTGVQGIANSTAFFAAAVWGNATATTGLTRGVYGTSSSSSGIGVHGIAQTGGQFETGSGNEIIGRGLGHTNFRVDDTGKVFADGGFQASGADFAESFAVRGDRNHYEAGDLLAIDQSGSRRMALAQHPYSKLVAGIYSTKPGLLGTPHTISDPEIEQEVPLAVIGVVPCKVTAENGSITPGDLLVSSTTPGYAMKGTNRKRMLGAVVGKALEPLPSGKGTIIVLVTLQ
jgi:hypothetical protein